jgi:hypothetical protein
VIGSLIGVFVGNKLPEDLRNSLMRVLGLVVVLIGFSMALKTKDVIILVFSILLGTAIGEVIGIERALENFGTRVERRFEGTKFAEGFVSSTLLFCVGSMAIIGPIQEGLTGDFSLLLTKSMLDGISSIALASTLGIGVLFSFIPVLLYQGFFTVLAWVSLGFVQESVINELTAVGGLLIVAIGIKLMGVADLKPGNMLPSLVLSPIFMSVALLLQG